MKKFFEKHRAITSFADSHDTNMPDSVGIIAHIPAKMTNFRIESRSQPNFLTKIPPDNKPIQTVGGIAMPKIVKKRMNDLSYCKQ